MEIKYKIDILSGVKHEKMEIQAYTELIYAMEGNARITIYDKTYILRKNEYIVINFANRYSISVSDDTVLAVLDIDYPSLLQMTGEKWWQFNCNTMADTTRSHYNLKYYFTKMLRAHLLKNRQLEEKGDFYSVVDVLTTEYSQKEPGTRKQLDNTKMDRVLLYLNTNFKEKITIDDVCRQFFYANSTFSRNFKIQTGTNFVQYLNELRIRSAVSELMSTDHSVTEIALGNGFGDIAVFNKVFKKIMGISPLQYKKKIIEKENMQQSVKETIIQNVENRFINDTQLNLENNENKVYEEIEMNVRADTAIDSIWTKAIGVKDASLLLSAAYQEQIKVLSGRMHLQYLRIDGIFSKKMNIRENTETENLNFKYIDDVLDYCIDNHFIPILEISGMKQVVIDDNHELICMENQSDFFADYDDYAQFMKKFFEHVSFRFTSGAERIHEWVWELSFDRKIFSWEEYEKQFQLVYERVKKWNCKLGGYGIFLGCQDEDEIERFVKMNCPPDFISVFAYPYELRRKTQKVAYYERSMDEKFFKNNMLKFKDFLSRIGYQKMPVWMSRWNVSLVEKNVFNDSFAKAAHMMSIVSDLTNIVDMAVYDSASDLESNSHSDYIFIGGAGLLSKDGLEKPSAVLLTDLSFLGKRLVQKGNHHFFTLPQNNHLIGLCYNHQPFNLNYYQKPEKLLEESDLSYIYESQDSLEQEIKITNLANGIYRIKYGLISKKGSILSKYRNMCSNVVPDIGDLRILKMMGYVEVTTIERKVKNHELSILVNLKANEAVCLNIIPAYLD